MLENNLFNEMMVMETNVLILDSTLKGSFNFQE